MSRKFFAALFVLTSAMMFFLDSATGTTTGELLERGIYAEETVGDLEAAMEIYERIIEDADAARPYAAQAMFRLGKCYLKREKQERAALLFKRLIKEYPDQEEFASMAREYLPENGEGWISLNPAPWIDGEWLRYKIIYKSGKVLGDMMYAAELKRRSDQEIWRIVNYAVMPSLVPGRDILKYCAIEAEKDSFRPVSSQFFHTQLGDAVTEYTGEERRMMLNRPGGEPEPFIQQLTGPAYDNEQNYFLIRRLPLTDDYTIDVPFAGRPGSVYPAEIKVTGTETVTVPAGEFECFRISAVTLPGSREEYWFSKDERRLMVKMNQTDVTVELMEAARFTEKEMHFRDVQNGFSLQVPAGWKIFRSSVDMPYVDVFIQIVSPELKALGDFACRRKDKETGLPQIIEEEIRDGIHGNETYKVREGSRSEGELSGFPMMSYIADYTVKAPEDTLWKKTEYRAYINSGVNLYWFTFDVSSNEYDRYRKNFDSIMNSLRLAKE